MMDQEYTPKDESRPGYPEQDPGLRALTSTDLEALIRQQVAEEEARQEHVRATGGLSEYHRNVILKDRAITLEIAKAAGLRTHVANTAEYRQWRKKYGLPREPEDIEQLEGAGTYPVDGMFMPYQAGELGRMVYWRLRYDDTTFKTWSNEMDESGISGCWETAQCPRYHGKPGAPVCPYIPALIDSPEARAAFGFDDAEPLFVTEAPLKCLSLYSHGFKGVGLGGVLAGCHQKRVDKRLKVTAHPEMKRINWHGRRCYTVFDAGQTTNPMVALGVAYCWQALSGLGGEIYTVTIPERAKGKTPKERDQGPDDFLYAEGKDKFQVLVDAAYLTDPRMRVEKVAEIPNVAARKTALFALCDDLVFQACLSLMTKAQLGMVASVSKRVLTQAILKDSVAEFRKKLSRTKDDEDEEAVRLEHQSNACIARALVEIIAKSYSPTSTEASRERVVYDQGSVWAFDEKVMRWVGVSDDVLSVEIQKLDGTALKGSDRLCLIQTVDAATNMFRALVARPGFFEGAPRGVAFSNGFVTVKDGGRIERQPLSLTQRARFGYDFPHKDSVYIPLTVDYFDRVFAGTTDLCQRQAVLMEHAGLCLLGLGSHFNKAILCHDDGMGGGGKSQWLQLVEAMFPEGSVGHIAPHQMGGSEQGAYYRAALAGCLINIVNELPETEIAGTDGFKAIVDGNMISCRNPAGRPFDVKPIAGQLFSCNGTPPVRDQSDAMYDRWVQVFFPNKIRGTANEVQEIWQMIAKAELPDLIAACLQNAAMALARGHLTIPPSSIEYKHEWRVDCDPVAAFVEEMTTPDDGKAETRRLWASLEALWAEFDLWTKSKKRGEKLAQNTFAKRLKSHLGKTWPGKLPVHLESGNRYPVILRVMKAYQADSATYDAEALN